MGGSSSIVLCEDIAGISAKAADIFIRSAKNAIKERGVFTVSLAGGSTPAALYRLLATTPCSSEIEWGKTHLFWGDERCVPHDHKDSNYRMVREALIDSINIPSSNIHPVRGEMGEAAAENYEKELKGFFGVEEGIFPAFDLILLGMGDDGHTASLFPETEILKEEKAWVGAVYVEKFKSVRATLTVPVLNNAREIVFLVSGGGKSSMLKTVLEGDYRPDKYPSQFLRGAKGKTTWLVDKAAAAAIS